MPSGFGSAVQRAVRRDDPVNKTEGDWSTYHVDYNFFKHRIQVFADRRAALRSLIRDNYGRGGYSPKEEVALIMNQGGTYEEAVADRAEQVKKDGGTIVAKGSDGEEMPGPAGLILSIPSAEASQKINNKILTPIMTPKTHASSVTSPPLPPHDESSTTPTFSEDNDD
eukprot:9460070-Ditylum_brightwellii.AAC.1